MNTAKNARPVVGFVCSYTTTEQREAMERYAREHGFTLLVSHGYGELAERSAQTGTPVLVLAHAQDPGTEAFLSGRDDAAVVLLFSGGGLHPETARSLWAQLAPPGRRGAAMTAALEPGTGGPNHITALNWRAAFAAWRRTIDGEASPGGAPASSFPFEELVGPEPGRSDTGGEPAVPGVPLAHGIVSRLRGSLLLMKSFLEGAASAQSVPWDRIQADLEEALESARTLERLMRDPGDATDPASPSATSTLRAQDHHCQ